ncbi:MAG: lamin tail domain-containing protein, partial [Candidatus Bipolaricaulota bacterium]
TDVSVSDPKVGPVSVSPTTLAPGEQATGTVTYTITQEDIDAGEVLNLATATGADPNDVPVEDEDDEDVPLDQDPELEVNKSADRITVGLGETVTYTFVVTNVGNVTLYDVSVVDSALGPVALTPTTLAPGEVVTGTLEYTVEEPGICGSLLNTATVEATDPTDSVVTAISEEVSVLITYTAEIMIDKSTTWDTKAEAGDVIPYTITVTNAGDVSLRNVEVVDSLLGELDGPEGDVNDDGVLGVDETWVYSANYTVTQADASGPITNTATVEAEDPCGNLVGPVSDAAQTPWWNEPPTVESQAVTICHDTPVSLILVGSDPDVDPEDPDAHPLTFSIVGEPEHGALSGNMAAVTYTEPHDASVEVLYAPEPDFLGTDVFTFMVQDPYEEFVVASVEITVVDCSEEVAGGAAALMPVVINEVAWDGTEASQPHQWVELANTTHEEIDLTGWTLRWHRKQPETVLDRYVKVVELDGVIDPYGHYLMERRMDDVVSDIQADLIYDHTGPIVISEIAWGGTPARPDDEWIELTNVNGETIDLTGWTLRWRLASPTTDAEREWKAVELDGTLAPYAPYLLVRGSDDVVSDIRADLIYDATLELDDRGEVMELLDPSGRLVDSANVERTGQTGWEAGYRQDGAAPYATMERVNVFQSDTAQNWRANQGIISRGVDREGNALVGTPRAVNERTLLWAYPSRFLARIDAEVDPAELVTLPFGDLELSSQGEVLELVDAAGVVVDTANADRPERDGWAAGYGIDETPPFGTMERVDPGVPDIDENWRTSAEITVSGLDDDGTVIMGTPRMRNEDLWLRELAAQEEYSVTRGQPYAVVVPASRVDTPEVLPWVALVKVDPDAPKYSWERFDGAVTEPVPETPPYRWVVDTSDLPKGSYQLWLSWSQNVVYGFPFRVMSE